jgi:peptidoglycan/xylan/chitin deacetylase (PgdA/CDA1 family)
MISWISRRTRSAAMISKKELLAKVLYHSGLLGAVSSLAPKGIVILTYHRIRPDTSTADADLFDDALFGPTQSEFERQVRWLKQNFELLSEASLLSVLREGNACRRRYAAITFDDGYRDNYTLAYPVLRGYSTPAIFFICPGLIDNRKVGWWDAIAYLIKRSDRSSVSINGTTLPLQGNKQAAITELTSWIKVRPHAETSELVPKLADVCGVNLPDAELQDRQFMTWEQIIEVSRNGVDIGSHTYHHHVLATLGADLQRWELRESKVALQRRLGRPIRTLAYPVGGYEHFTPETMRIAEEIGYECAFSFQTGYNLGGIHRFNVQRISSANGCHALFACSTQIPNVFTWLRPMPASHRSAV